MERRGAPIINPAAASRTKLMPRIGAVQTCQLPHISGGLINQVDFPLQVAPWLHSGVVNCSIPFRAKPCLEARDMACSCHSFFFFIFKRHARTLHRLQTTIGEPPAHAHLGIIETVYASATLAVPSNVALSILKEEQSSTT